MRWRPQIGSNDANPAALGELWKSASGFYLIFCLIYCALLTWKNGFLMDAHGYVAGRDMLNFWMAGKIALLPDPAHYYDADRYMALLEPIAGSGYWPSQLSYPPSLFLLAAPIGLLPYWLALAGWMALTIALLHRAVRLGPKPGLFPLLILSPAALVALLCGQHSFLFAAIILVAFHYLDRKPWLAGVLIGLLTIKPQLGLLFPILLLCSGRFRVIAAATLTAAAIAGASILAFGLDAWRIYFLHQIPEQMVLLKADTKLLEMVTSLMPTVFNDLRLIGVAYETCLWVQYGLTAFAVGVVIFATRRKLPPEILFAIFAAASVLATPYLLSYDLITFSWAMVLLLATRPWSRGGQWLFALAYWLPFFDLVLNKLGIPGPSLLPVAVIIFLLRTKSTASATTA